MTFLITQAYGRCCGSGTDHNRKLSSAFVWEPSVWPDALKQGAKCGRNREWTESSKEIYWGEILVTKFFMKTEEAASVLSLNTFSGTPVLRLLSLLSLLNDLRFA